MCGIVGQLTFSDRELRVQEGEVSPLLIARMARRGPDDEGVWSDGRGVTLGLRRLAILDLSPSGRQPMLTEDGRYAIVYKSCLR